MIFVTVFTPGVRSSSGNLGPLLVNAISDKSFVVIGQNNPGDFLTLNKLNNVFGVVFGNANLIPTCLNLVIDPDCLDQFGPQNSIRPRFGTIENT